MKILSIDCGIKNLAICFLTITALSTKQLRTIQDKIAKISVLDKENEYKDELSNLYNDCVKKDFKIHFWDNINMFPLDSRFDDLKCEFKANCYQPVKYHKNYEQGYCTRHAKKVKGLREIKEKNAKLISYVDIAKAIMVNLDKLDFSGVEKIFIEQQPQKNGRMKHFQMMLFQYLVMRYGAVNNLTIHFVSPKHKLRAPDCSAFYKASTKKNKYAQNKEVSIQQTHKLLKTNKSNQKWYKFLCGIKTKQDDYCDCFLQAYMFFDVIN